MLKLKLHWQILIAIVLAVICGSFTRETTEILGVNIYDSYAFVGTLFLNALKMVIVPLIVSSIIVGVAGVGDQGGVGRLGVKTLSFYTASSALAILVGLLVVNIIQPGIIDGKAAGPLLALSEDTQGVVDKVSGRGLSDVANIFLRMVPTNVVGAAAEGKMLGLIVFCLLFGVFMTRITREYSIVLLKGFQGVFEVMMAMTMFIMRFAPLGVFALVAKVVTVTGFEAFRPLMWFFISVVIALSIHAFVTLPIILKLVAKVSPLKHIQAMTPAMLTAFSTASSSATLPMTMNCVENNAGVSKRSSSFVLPLGATVNMDGTALYECVAAMFIAQAYGLELGLATQFLIVLTALLTSIGVAGIPAASLVAITIILTAIGLPLEAVGLILVTDRVLDMFRTSVNVFSDSCGAVVVARSEGEETALR